MGVEEEEEEEEGVSTEGAGFLFTMSGVNRFPVSIIGVAEILAPSLHLPLCLFQRKRSNMLNLTTLLHAEQVTDERWTFLAKGSASRVFFLCACAAVRGTSTALLTTLLDASGLLTSGSGVEMLEATSAGGLTLRDTLLSTGAVRVCGMMGLTADVSLDAGLVLGFFDDDATVNMGSE